MTPARSKAALLALAAVALAWSIPGCFLYRFFAARRWFPFNVTGLLADKLTDPASPGAVLAVSAATPLFWALLLFTVVILVRRLRRRPLRPRDFLISAFTAALFVLAEFLLPWRGEMDVPHPLAFLFPIIHSGHGRAYELIYAYAAPVWDLFRRLE